MRSRKVLLAACTLAACFPALLTGCGARRAIAPSDATTPSRAELEEKGWLVADATQAHIEEAARKRLPVVVKLGSETCEPCREMNPVIAELARHYSGRIVFLMVDVYRNPAVASKYGVRVIPTMVYIDLSGRATAYSEGYAGVEEMKSFIDRSGILEQAG